jgi:hypothetical protein
VIQLIGTEEMGLSPDELEEAYVGIGETLRGLFHDADATGVTPAVAAERLAAERVAAAAQL